LSRLKSRSILLILVIVVAALAGAEYYSQKSGSSGSSNSLLVNIEIIGTPAAGTVDYYSPSNFTVREGQTVTLAVLNTDDNTHGLVIRAFGVDTGKIDPGQTDRVTFLANQTGTFQFFEPAGYCTGGLGNHCNSIQHMTGNMTVVPSTG
jgi:plastocyanin